jgi:hypothetical protein
MGVMARGSVAAVVGMDAASADGEVVPSLSRREAWLGPSQEA